MAIHAHGPSPKGLLCNAGAGAAAGVIAATFVCPLDVIKTRFQVHRLPQLSSASVKGSVIVGSLEHIFQKEGFMVCTVDSLPRCLHCFHWAVYFTIYEQLKSSLGADDVNHHLSVGANMLAASGAGAATTIATNPPSVGCQDKISSMRFVTSHPLDVAYYINYFAGIGNMVSIWDQTDPVVASGLNQGNNRLIFCFGCDLYRNMVCTCMKCVGIGIGERNYEMFSWASWPW